MYRLARINRIFFIDALRKLHGTWFRNLGRSQSCVKVQPRLLTKLSGNSNVHSGDGGSNAGVFLRWNACSFDAVSACGRLVGLAGNGN